VEVPAFDEKPRGVLKHLNGNLEIVIDMDRL
jgi:hypothetical protein